MPVSCEISVGRCKSEHRRALVRRGAPMGEPMQAFRTKRTAAIDLLPPEREGRRPSRAALRDPDYIDVEFETLGPSPRRGPYPVFNDNRRTGARLVSRPMTSGGMSLPRQILARMAARLDAMPPRRFAGLVAGAILAAFLAISGLAGQSEADAHPLAIEDVTAALRDSGGMRVLSVYATIGNRSEVEQRLPSVVVDVMSNGRKITATRLLPEGAAMAPGERRHLVARLPYAGGKKPDVTVSFDEDSASLR